MITLIFNKEEYEYDCYALVTSLYPGEETRQISDAGSGGVADSICITVYPEKGHAEVVITAGEVLPESQEYDANRTWKANI